MATIVKITTDSEGGAPLDAVENLLKRATEGEDVIAFTDQGDIVYANTGEDAPHEFEEV